MDCRRMDEILDDFVDGILPEGEADNARDHVASCARCRAEVEGLKALLDRTAGLPPSLEPSRDLWRGIEARIGGRRAPAAPQRPALHPGIAWAAALLLAIASVAAIVFMKPAPAPRTSAAPNPSLASLRAAEPDYVKARKQLVEALRARRGQLSPETLKVIEENLAVMDRSLAAMKKALEKDPGNRGLAVLIESTYRQELELLLQADRLPPNV